MTSTTSEVTAYFWGGPEDGREQKFPLPLSETLEVIGHKFQFTPEGGEPIKRCKIYRYRLVTTGRRRVYTYEGDYIGKEADA